MVNAWHFPKSPKLIRRKCLSLNLDSKDKSMIGWLGPVGVTLSATIQVQPMRRTLIIYSFFTSIGSAFAMLCMTGLSLSLINYWRYLEPDGHPLPSWSINVPNITRAATIVPLILFVISLLSFKRGWISDRVLLHGIGLTALVVVGITIFAVAAALMPAIVTIVEIPVEEVIPE